MLRVTGGRVVFWRIASLPIADVPLQGTMLGFTRVDVGTTVAAKNPALLVQVEELFLMPTFFDVQGAFKFQE